MEQDILNKNHEYNVKLITTNNQEFLNRLKNAFYHVLEKCGNEYKTILNKFHEEIMKRGLVLRSSSDHLANMSLDVPVELQVCLKPFLEKASLQFLKENIEIQFHQDPNGSIAHTCKNSSILFVNRTS